MSHPARLYRTLIHGVIEQTTALSVGGFLGVHGASDTCYRDGLGRLTIPGTSLAGALIETAARLFPDLIGKRPRGGLFGGRITGKQRHAPRRVAQGTEDFLQSVWRFYNSHPDDERQATEWRQGVGIRHATGATAAEKRALYDFECVPAATRWSFFLEVDTHRGNSEAEAAAILALDEWRHGRGWLGRGAARGTGWFRLADVEIIRLPCTPAALEAWPNNQQPLQNTLEEIRRLRDVALPSWEETLQAAREEAVQKGWSRGTWYYLTIPIRIAPARDLGGYGWNPLHVGGHPAAELEVRETGQLRPLSVAEDTAWQGEPYQRPDSPFVCTWPASKAQFEPFLPGSGLRGALRHTVSRLARARNIPVLDPNAPSTSDPEIRRFREGLQTRRRSDPLVSEGELRELADPVTQAFGIEELCARVLVSDARLVSEGAAFTFARAEHHAEDEFMASVYGTGKFDRDLLLQGPMEFRIVLEASSAEELRSMAQTLAPALELARLGHLPLGGGKWRGAGWVPWEIGLMELARAGDGAGSREDSMPDPAERTFADRLKQLLSMASARAG